MEVPESVSVEVVLPLDVERIFWPIGKGYKVSSLSTLYHVSVASSVFVLAVSNSIIG
jgi:hypothetical protein